MKNVPVKDFETSYLIYEDSRIYSIKYKIFIKQQLNKITGYTQVTLCKNGKHKTRAVHQLVLLSFNPKPSNKHQVNHKNGNKLDNRLVNLEWMTRSENTQHAHDTIPRKPLLTKNKPFSKPRKKVLPKGVTMHHSGFRVRISNNKVTRGYTHLGVFDTLEEAMIVYQTAHIDKYGKDPYTEEMNLCHNGSMEGLVIKGESK